MAENIAEEPQEVVEDIGVEYNEEQSEVKEDKPAESDERKEVETDQDETPKEKRERTKEELIDLAKEMYGVDEKDVVIDKKGNLKLVMKINGKKRLVDPQKDIMKGFNLNQAGYEKLNEAKATVKQVQGFFDEVRQDPSKIWEIADKMQIDKYQLAQSLLQTKVDEYSLTDEEKRVKELERREEEIRKRDETEKKNAETTKYNEEKQKEMQRYGDELVSAMTELGFTNATKLTKSHLLKSAVQELSMALSAGREMTTKDAVSRAIYKWKESVHGIFEEIDDDHIIKIIPDRIVKAIQKASLNRGETRIPTSNSQSRSKIDQDDQSNETAPRKKSKNKIAVSDYFGSL